MGYVTSSVKVWGQKGTYTKKVAKKEKVHPTPCKIERFSGKSQNRFVFRKEGEKTSNEKRETKVVFLDVWFKPTAAIIPGRACTKARRLGCFTCGIGSASAQSEC
jgi:hypothetical protein